MKKLEKSFITVLVIGLVLGGGAAKAYIHHSEKDFVCLPQSSSFSIALSCR